MPPSHRKTPTRPTPRARVAGAACAFVLALWLLPATPATAAAKPGPRFDAFTKAWTAGSADGVVATMAPKGGVRFDLLAYPLAGKARTMKPKQARATLKAYFKRLGGIALVDKTPKRSPANVRIYEYSYKPTGESKRTTRLQVQLKQDGNGRWVLASVNESP